jgi:integrase
MGKLSATQVRSIKQPGRYQDGDGLMLIVSSTGAASWLLRTQAGKRRREFGLGSLRNVSLAEAREAAAAVRKQFKAGVDPLAEKRKAARQIPTFREAAEKAHSERRRTWRNGKHSDQWLATLERYAFPTIGGLPVNGIDGPAIRDVLLPIWLEIPETARRVRQRIGAVLDWAHGNGFRDTEAPIRSISRALPRQPRKDGHFAAMPYQEVPAFLKALRCAEPSFGRMAVEAAVLTATRSGEVRGARWSEVDLEAALWTIPAARMKGGKAHAVPLSEPAIEVFRRATELRRAGCDFIFQGMSAKRPMSDMTMLKVLRDMDLSVTVHGFRSSFRDWVAEETAFPAEVAEAALAHAVPDRVVAAYRRTDFLEKRRQLMTAWADYLADAPADVIKFPGRRVRSGDVQ